MKRVKNGAEEVLNVELKNKRKNHIQSNRSPFPINVGIPFPL